MCQDPPDNPSKFSGSLEVHTELRRHYTQCEGLSQCKDAGQPQQRVSCVEPSPEETTCRLPVAPYSSPPLHGEVFLHGFHSYSVHILYSG